MPTKKQIANGCKHFNGIQHDTCRAGIAYKQFLNENYPNFPCLTRQDGTLSGACASFEFSTEDEIEAHEKASAQAAANYFKALNAHVCPECGQSTLPEKQVGRCVYGACGHRLYQGKLSKS